MKWPWTSRSKLTVAQLERDYWMKRAAKLWAENRKLKQR